MADQIPPAQPLSPADKLRAMAPDPDPAGIESEHALWKGSYSPKAMTGAWILAGIVSLVVIGLLAFTGLGSIAYAWTVALVGLLLYWLILLGLMLYRKLSMYYELTSQRLKHREGILVRSLDRIELIDIDDVMYRQGPIQALLGVGNITVKSSDTSHPELVMYGIADIRRVADMIDDARRTERRKRGLHIESI